MIDEKKFDFFQKTIEKILESSFPPALKLEKVHFLFLSIIEMAIETERLHFTTTFSKLTYLAQKFEFAPKLRYHANAFRIKYAAKQPLTEDEQSALAGLGIAVCIRLLEALAGKKTVTQRKEKWPSLPPFHPKGARPVKFFQHEKLVVTGIDKEKNLLTGFRESDLTRPVYIRYNVPDRNENFRDTINILERVSGFPSVIGLIDIEMDEEGFLSPRAFILEPDYLMDVSVIATAAAQGQTGPRHYLIKKYLPYVKTDPIVLGDIANFFLDELVSDTTRRFKELFPKVFKQNPILFATWDDKRVREIYQKSQKHFVSIHKVILQDFPAQKIDPQGAVIEPSFMSDKYGIQGRLDLFYQSPEGKSHIVELKSGSNYMPNKYGLSQSHYTQTLLYDLLIRSVYQKTDPISYILYSKLDVDQLKYATRVRALQYEALQSRNLLIGIEQSLCGISPDRLAQKTVLDNITPALFHKLKGFTARDFENFYETYSGLDELEKRYFKAFSSFIAREHWLAKLGDTSPTERGGQAQLWLRNAEEKEDNFSILKGLKLESIEHYPLLKFKKTPNSNQLANFRQGDIVILHPEDGQSIMHQQIVKGNISYIDEKSVVVQLRSLHVSPEKLMDAREWTIEPDLLEGGFRSNYRLLFEWAQLSDKRRRNLLLGRTLPAAPEQAPEVVFEDLTEEQNHILTRMLAARDYFILWGPPGTGKTQKVIRSAVHHLTKNTGQRVLLLAYTNRAVDEICEAIESGFPEIRELYFRIGNPHATKEKFREVLLSSKIETIQNRKSLKELILRHRIVVSTVASIVNRPKIFELMQFDTTIVDEASQILEPQIIGILSRIKRFILVGDHRQLPAVVLQKKVLTGTGDSLLNEIGLTDLRNSYFERLFNVCKSKAVHHAFGMLSMQGRMHRDIMAFPNLHFYENKLQILPQGLNPRQSDTHYLTTSSENSLRKKLAAHRVLYCPTPIDESVGSGKKNIHEAKAIVEILEHLEALYKENQLPITSDSIGIITPYKAQIAQIREMIHKKVPHWEEHLTIDTVERYQGGARDIIIISVCLNNPYQLNTLVSLSQDGVDRKLNVAVTRARQQLIMIGNEALLRQDKYYRAFIAGAERLKQKNPFDMVEGTNSNK